MKLLAKEESLELRQRITEPAKKLLQENGIT